MSFKFAGLAIGNCSRCARDSQPLLIGPIPEQSTSAHLKTALAIESERLNKSNENRKIDKESCTSYAQGLLSQRGWASLLPIFRRTKRRSHAARAHARACGVERKKSQAPRIPAPKTGCQAEMRAWRRGEPRGLGCICGASGLRQCKFSQ